MFKTVFALAAALTLLDAPYCEPLAHIRQLAVEALLFLNSLRGQVGGQS